MNEKDHPVQTTNLIENKCNVSANTRSFIDSLLWKEWILEIIKN
jgi:hypothetical protein